jgi:hypothetical protein
MWICLCIMLRMSSESLRWWAKLFSLIEKSREKYLNTLSYIFFRVKNKLNFFLIEIRLNW